MAAKVLILGGGFAGLSAVATLAAHGRRGEVRIECLDRRAESTFLPLLPDLISGRLRGEHLLFPIAPFCAARGAIFRQAEVRTIDLQRPAAVVADGLVTADYVILAIGCDTATFGRADLAGQSMTLKSAPDGPAIAQRLRLLTADLMDGRVAASAPAVVVVGGGYTGLEAASHAAWLLRRLRKLSPERLKEPLPVLVVEKGDVPLSNASPATRAWTLRAISGYGVEVRTRCTVEAIEGRTVRLTDGDRLSPAVVIWAPGVAPGPAAADLPRAASRGRRVQVNTALSVAGAERVFAAGDIAAATPPGHSQPLRMGVQFSLRAGRSAAMNVLRHIRGRPMMTFDPLDPGYLLPLSPTKASGRVLGAELRGRLPAGLHYFMSVLRSWSWSNRIGIMKDLGQAMREEP